MTRIKELDGLRAIAILLVLGCHYEGFARLFGGLPEFGWIGVDIFFVLSGYLITSILLGLRDQPSPYTTFYSRRAIRIFPPYLLVVGAVTAVGVLRHRPELYASAFLLKQVFFLEAYDPHAVHFLHDFLLHLRWYLLHPPNLLHGGLHLLRGAAGLQPTLAGPASTFWSLSVEEYFYVLWAPVVLRCSRRTIVVTGIAVCVVEAVLRLYAPWQDSYLGLFFRFDSLLYGALLALLLERWRHHGTPAWSANLFRSLLAGSTIFLVWMLSRFTSVLGREIRGAPLFLALGLPAMCAGTAGLLGLLISRANSRWWLARMLRARPIQFVGTISYTMYLTHIFVAVLVLIAFTALAHGGEGHALLAQAVVSSVATILVARLSWHWFEKPLLRWKEQRFPGVRVTQPSLE